MSEETEQTWNSDTSILKLFNQTFKITTADNAKDSNRKSGHEKNFKWVT